MRNCFQDRVNYQCQGSSLSDLSTFDNPLAENSLNSLPCKDDVAEREINFSLATSFSFSKSSEKKKLFISQPHIYLSPLIWAVSIRMEVCLQSSSLYTGQRLALVLWSLSLGKTLLLHWMLWDRAQPYLGIRKFSKFHHLFPQNHKDCLINYSLLCNPKLSSVSCQFQVHMPQ